VVLIAVGAFVSDHEIQAGTFFGGGFLLLTAGLAALWMYLVSFDSDAQQGSSAAKRLQIVSLAARKASRHPTRRPLTAGLLASSAFLIVGVESFRRQPGKNFLDKKAGSGGFALLAESDLPVFQDLNTGPGRQEILDALERSIRGQIGADKTEERLRDAERILKDATIAPLRLRAGDDTSCLNLYQPGRPRLLGVPHSLIARDGFHFAKIQKPEGWDKDNPWLLLEEKESDGAIPVFGEANSVAWMLKKNLGDTIEIPNERNEPVKLRIVGLFK